MGANDAMAYFKSGEAHFQNGEIAAAIADLSQAISLDPNYADAYCTRGFVHGGIGKFAEAIDDFTQYIRIVGDRVAGNEREEAMLSVAYSTRGMTYCEIDQYDKAIDDFSEAIRLTPKNVDAYLGRAHAHRKNKTIDKAVTDIEAALRIEPDNAEAKKFLGQAKKMQLAKNQFCGGDYWNNYEQIVKDTSQIIEFDPGFAEAHFIRGLAYTKLGKQEDALNDYEKAAELDPGKEDYVKMLVAVYSDFGKMCVSKNSIGDGISYYNKALNLDGGDVLSLEGRAAAYMLIGKYDLAIDDFNRILKINPNHPNARNFIEEARRYYKPPVSPGKPAPPSRPAPQTTNSTIRPAPRTTNSTALPAILSVIAVLVFVVAGIVLFRNGGLDFLKSKIADVPASLPQDDHIETEQSEPAAEQNRPTAKQSGSAAKQSGPAAEKNPGYFVDSRDGQEYRAVRIGNKTWMNRNLNYRPQTGMSWCYNDNASNCAKYGRLYDWNTATTVCPAGWHLPNRQEWGQLANAAGGNAAGTALKTTNGWIDYGNGTDKYGFSAQPGGSRTIDAEFKNAGNRGLWWTATEYDRDSAYYRRMGYNYDYAYEGTYGKRHGFSVRCVQ